MVAVVAEDLNGVDPALHAPFGVHHPDADSICAGDAHRGIANVLGAQAEWRAEEIDLAGDPTAVDEHDHTGVRRVIVGNPDRTAEQVRGPTGRPSRALEVDVPLIKRRRRRQHQLPEGPRSSRVDPPSSEHTSHRPVLVLQLLKRLLSRRERAGVLVA